MNETCPPVEYWKLVLMKLYAYLYNVNLLYKINKILNFISINKTNIYLSALGNILSKFSLIGPRHVR
jgi:hypothetical protein